ncbi:MAG: prepilin-type N-terminal cleavage/methylation domain-containing protein [Planctomycetes bacterium]|nr:prepilin-type N-terminal cleavage/methylation domain-containing protein [Planctomycetota bacterium]
MNSTRRHGAFSLMEVMISIALLATVVALAMESLMAGQNYDRFATMQDDLAVESTRIMASIREDLASSAWEFPTEPRSSYSGASATADRALRYYPFVQIQSPGSPAITTGLGSQFAWSHRPANMVVIGGIDGSHHPTSWHDAGQVDIGVPEDFTKNATDAHADAVSRGTATGSTVGAQLDYWYRSFYARSQEILFLRSTVSAWNESTNSYTGASDMAPLLKFKGTRQQWSTPGYHDQLQIFRASGWYATKDLGGAVIGWNAYAIPGSTIYNANNFPYGVVMEAGYLSDPTAGTIGMNWRTTSGRAFEFDYIPPLAATATAGAIKDAYAADLQAYSYCVVPSRIGFGRLVRAHKAKWTGTSPTLGGEITNPAWGTELGQKISDDGTYGLVVDRILSDHVMRICFDTFRSVSSLSSADRTAFPAVNDFNGFDINQVRVRLYLGARATAGTGATVTRLVETTLAMRGRNTQTDKNSESNDSIAQILGTDAVGLPR